MATLNNLIDEVVFSRFEYFKNSADICKIPSEKVDYGIHLVFFKDRILQMAAEFFKNYYKNSDRKSRRYPNYLIL